MAKNNDNTNPKDLIGSKKDNIGLVPPEGIIGISRAMKNGADKYGAYNWRSKKVQYQIYLDAILRHTLALIEREDLALDSGCHHLDHIGANVCILKDAMKYHCLIDNRPDVPVATQETVTIEEPHKCFITAVGTELLSEKHHYPESFNCKEKHCTCTKKKQEKK